MALKLVKTFSGNNLAMNFDGVKGVLMESPAPYADRATLEIYKTVPADSTITTTSSTVKLAVSGTDVNREYGGRVVFYMIYDGSEKLTFTLTAGAGARFHTGFVGAQLPPGVGFGTGLNLKHSGPLSGTVTQPYYRYRLVLQISFYITAPPSAVSTQWAQITIT